VVFPPGVVLIGQWDISPLLAIKCTHNINSRHAIILYLKASISRMVQERVIPYTLACLTCPKATCLTKGVSSESFVSILECITLLTHVDESTRTINCCEFSAIFEINSHASYKVFFYECSFTCCVNHATVHR